MFHGGDSLLRLPVIEKQAQAAMRAFSVPKSSANLRKLIRTVYRHLGTSFRSGVAKDENRRDVRPCCLAVSIVIVCPNHSRARVFVAQ